MIADILMFPRGMKPESRPRRERVLMPQRRDVKYTYNLALFFGPGLPLTLGVVSDPKAAVELLLTPAFFLIASFGGGINDGTGVAVPFGAGVSGFDSDGASPFWLVATGKVLGIVEVDSFDGESSLVKG